MISRRRCVGFSSSIGSHHALDPPISSTVPSSERQVSPDSVGLERFGAGHAGDADAHHSRAGPPEPWSASGPGLPLGASTARRHRLPSPPGRRCGPRSGATPRKVMSNGEHAVIDRGPRRKASPVACGARSFPSGPLLTSQHHCGRHPGRRPTRAGGKKIGHQQCRRDDDAYGQRWHRRGRRGVDP